MIGKKKLSAIFAVLLLTVSFLIMIPIPVSAATPDNSEVCLENFLWKYPNGTKVYNLPLLIYLGYVPPYPAGTLIWSPFNTTLNYPANASLLGALPVLAVVIRNTTADGFSMSSWEFGCKWNSEVLGYPVTFYHRGAESLPAPGLPPTIFEAKWPSNANQTVGTINIFKGEVKGYKMALNDSTSITVTSPKILCYIVPTIVNYGETLLDIASYVKIDDQGTVYTPSNIINGYLKFRIHEVKISPTIWVNPPYSIGNTLVEPISIQTTEPVHTWELNMSYYGVTEYGTPTTPTINCSSISEGNFLLLSNKTDPHGGNTFNSQVGPGWIWANGTYTAPTQYAEAWFGATLMVINFTVLAYGTTMLSVDTFSAKDTTGAEITPLTNVNLALGLRMNYFKFEKLVSIAPIFVDTGTPTMIWSYPTHNIGEQFSMAVNIVDTSQNVHSWKSGFRFNPLVLAVDSVAEGTYLSSQGVTTFNPNIVIDNVNGEVYNITCTGDPGVDNSGFGTLYTITFNVTGYGRSLISFTDKDTDVTETKLQDNAGNEIRNPGGLYFITSLFEFRAPITVKTLGVHVKPGQVFTVTLEIRSEEKVNSWQSGITFNKTQMQCTGVAFGAWNAPGQPQYFIDNTNGYVSVGKAFYAGNYSIGNGTLATLTFQLLVNWTCDVTDFPFGPFDLGLTASLGQPTQTLVLDLSGDACALNTLVNGKAVVYGDANANGVVTSTDVTVNNALLTKLMLELITMQEALDQSPWCDVNNSGALTSTDVTLQNAALTKLMLEICPWW